MYEKFCSTDYIHAEYIKILQYELKLNI